MLAFYYRINIILQCSSVKIVNKERARNALPPLEFAVIEVISSTSTTLKDEDLKNLKLSSTFLREYIFNKKLEDK